MEIYQRVKITKEEIEKLIKKTFNFEGNLKFIIKEETFKCGVNDEGNVYDKRYLFDGVEIENSKLNKQK